MARGSGPRWHAAAAWLALALGGVGLLFLLGVFPEFWPALSFSICGLVSGWASLASVRHSVGEDGEGMAQDLRQDIEADDEFSSGAFRVVAWAGVTLSATVFLFGLGTYVALGYAVGR